MNFCSQFHTESGGRVTTLTIFHALSVFIISFVLLVHLLNIISSMIHKQNSKVKLHAAFISELMP